jgi:hypothetical protein
MEKMLQPIIPDPMMAILENLKKSLRETTTTDLFSLSTFLLTANLLT